MGSRYILKAVILIFFVLSIFSCKKRPDIDPLLIGSWRYKRASIHFIYNFRANGSFVIQMKKEGKFSRIIEKVGEIEGEWDVEGEEEKVIILMTATKTGDDKNWVKDQVERFEVLEINDQNLKLQVQDKKIISLSRVRGKQDEIDPSEMGFAVLRPGPFVVNLKSDRAHGKFRFLCIDLEFSIEDIEENDFVTIEKIPESEKVEYHIHPKIREVAIFYLSSLTYKDIKSLDKVKIAVNNLKDILSPYFAGELKDINVKKVVVTGNSQSVKEFEELYASGTVEGEEKAQGDNGEEKTIE